MDSTLKTEERKITEDGQGIDKIENSFIREEVSKLRQKEHETKAKKIAEQIINEWCRILDAPKLSLVKDMQKHADLSGKKLVDIIGQKNNEILCRAIESSNRIESYKHRPGGW